MLSAALLRVNSAPTLLSTPEFKAYVEYIIDGQNHSPSRYLFMQTVMQMATRCRAKIKSTLQKSLAFCIEEDSWTGDRSEFPAIRAGTASSSAQLHNVLPSNRYLTVNALYEVSIHDWHFLAQFAALWRGSFFDAVPISRNRKMHYKAPEQVSRCGSSCIPPFWALDCFQ
jgi:hypothetical protein